MQPNRTRRPAALIASGQNPSGPDSSGNDLSADAGPVFRDYRAPGGDGEVVFDPPASQIADQVRMGVAIGRDGDDQFGSLRAVARDQVLRDARHYSSRYRDVPSPTLSASGHSENADVDANGDVARPVIMSGHQPTLFHPGVWLKNFALDRLASMHDADAVNLVVDNDVAPSPSIRVPTRHLKTDRLGWATVAYDRSGGGVPFEQTRINDRNFFATFDARVRNELIGVVDDPMVHRLWDHARTAIGRCDVAACALAQARHAIEGEMGLSTLELPMSVVARSFAFGSFVGRILSDLGRFVKIYNRQTEVYRVAHGVRSAAHPVPNLRIENGWFECPLWLYGDDSPNRRPVWARRIGDTIELGDPDGETVCLPIGGGADDPDTDRSDDFGHAWHDHCCTKFKLRPRALLTTMYARLILSDLFIHGIGGGKYDQLGDLILGEFFDLRRCPPFLVVSATVHLPTPDDAIGSAASLDQQRRECLRMLRDTRYQPERFADDLDRTGRDLVDHKRTLLESIPPAGKRKRWHDRIDAINRDLFDRLAERRAAISNRLHRNALHQAERRILNSREHPFAIYPLEHLRAKFEDLVQRF